MTDVKIPRQIDEMDEAIYAWEDSIENLRVTQLEQMTKETMFKSWEASQKLAYIKIHKISAVMAEAEVRSKTEWVTKMIDLSQATVNLEEKKRLARLAEAKWETARSRQVTLRNVR